MTIRPISPADYAALAELEHVIFGSPASAASVAADSGVPTYAGFVAETDGHVIGRSATGFMPHATPAADLRCEVIVHPDQRGRGVGRALWEALHPVLAERRPVHLRANGNAQDSESLAWAQRRGFVITHQHHFQALDLAALDRPFLEAYVQAAEAQGFTFAPYASLRTPALDRHFYELYESAGAEVPDAAEWDEESFDDWRAFALERRPGAWPEGCLIALTPDGAWAGFTVMRHEPDAMAHVFLTGIVKEYRGRRLSEALKAAAVLHAAAHGKRRLTTLNHADNTRIVAANRRLGFQIQETLFRLVKRYAPAGSP